MEQKSLVTIKCLAYNHERYLRQCLDGFVIQRTNFKFIAIVHDDASTDKSAEIIREYANKYPDIIKPIFEDENMHSRYDGSLDRIINEALIKSESKYIAWCEGDDYWTDPYKLQKQIDFLEKNEEYSMCFHSTKIENETKNKPSINCENIEERTYTADEIFANWIIATNSVVFRKEVLSMKLKNSEKMLYGDIVMHLRCATYGKIYGLSDTMSVYRINQGGATQNEKYRLNKIIRYPKHLEFIKENFPILSKKSTNQQIGISFLEKAHIVDKIYTLIFWRDLFRALYYNPQCVADAIKHIIKKPFSH
ncbi:glycosyltransferase [Prevotella sp. HUN102]|uniref:glycosyltransferase n=1 Tax=Prevotella sp. HUN102 TaxID=1392486 RepID=UPI00068B7FE4|nr:glycosyltransferase [Prevotella sp. HUN102]